MILAQTLPKLGSGFKNVILIFKEQKFFECNSVDMINKMNSTQTRFKLGLEPTL